MCDTHKVTEISLHRNTPILREDARDTLAAEIYDHEQTCRTDTWV
jgi:hypothetical protein